MGAAMIAKRVIKPTSTHKGCKYKVKHCIVYICNITKVVRRTCPELPNGSHNENPSLGHLIKDCLRH